MRVPFSCKNSKYRAAEAPDWKCFHLFSSSKFFLSNSIFMSPIVGFQFGVKTEAAESLIA
jgi:hypothetical protein